MIKIDKSTVLWRRAATAPCLVILSVRATTTTSATATSAG